MIGLYVPLDEERDSENYFCKASVNIIIATNTLESIQMNNVVRYLLKVFFDLCITDS